VPWALSQGKSGPNVGLKQCSFSERARIVSENDKNMSHRYKILLLKALDGKTKLLVR
jgi:hypothetical protein